MKIPEKIVDLAVKKNIKISVVESVTGGKISSQLTSIEGSSKVFMAGIICYSEHSKIHAAGVDVQEINRSAGYSEKSAQMMAERVRKRNISDICISSTGCAGPDTVEGFENGRVIFALAVRNQDTQIFDTNFSGDREQVQQAATDFALKQILQAVENFS